MVRNIAALKNQGPSVTPRSTTPKPDTGGSDRAMLRGARTRAEAAPALTPAQSAYGPSGSQAQALASPRTQQFLQNYSRPTGSDFGGNFDDDLDLAVPVIQQRRPSDINWQDSSYNTQIAALERALRDFETGSTTRGQRYQQDFTTGLDRLGFRPAPQAMAARSMEGGPAGGGVGFATGPVQGEFDIEGVADRTSAAARGTRGMRDEFAGRGTLRSSDYVNSFRDFQNRLQQQLTGMETGRTRFGEDLQTELAQFQARTGEQKAAAEESARSRAIMRSIQEMGF